MKNAIIVHGKPRKETYYNPELPSVSNSLWIPWLQQQLSIRDISTQTPEMPRAWEPDYHLWCKEFERYEISPETILVGHSCGAGFLTQWLSTHPDVRVGHVVLVAPWLGATGTEALPEHDRTINGFFEFTIDPKLAERTASITLFHSDNDFDSVKEAVQNVRAAVPGIAYREFHNYGHFRSRDMGGDAFPELLRTIETALASS